MNSERKRGRDSCVRWVESLRTSPHALTKSWVWGNPPPPPCSLQKRWGADRGGRIILLALTSTRVEWSRFAVSRKGGVGLGRGIAGGCSRLSLTCLVVRSEIFPLLLDGRVMGQGAFPLAIQNVAPHRFRCFRWRRHRKHHVRRARSLPLHQERPLHRVTRRGCLAERGVLSRPFLDFDPQLQVKKRGWMEFPAVDLFLSCLTLILAV